MSNRIRCRTLFDITDTGIRSNYKTSRVPCVDDHGKPIQDLAQWTRARNQQRNWETVNQLISLRTLPEEISSPCLIDKDGNRYWEFEFSVPNIDALTINSDPIGALVHDSRGIPMILGLDETHSLSPVLEANGPETNIWFEVIGTK